MFPPDNNLLSRKKIRHIQPGLGKKKVGTFP